MFSRPHIGLQTRLVLALVATGAITLATGAFALVSPLTHRLREQQVQTVTTSLIEERARLQALPAASWRSGSSELVELASALRRRTGARVVIAQRGDVVFDSDPDLGRSWESVKPIASRALATHHSAREDVDIGSGDYVRVATPVDSPRGRVVVATVPLRESRAAASVVEGALVSSGLVGLVVALALGIGFGRGLSRRLRTLGATAEEISLRGAEVSVPADPTRDEVGALSRTLAQMRTNLRRQESARRTFIATASHELRTPLMSLHGTLEMLESDLRDDQAAPERLGELVRARRQCGRLESLAAGLLDVSRIDAGVELRKEPVELGLLAQAAVAEMGDRARALEVDLQIEPPGSPVWALCDPTGAVRIVRILLDNALNASRPGGSVWIEFPGGPGPGLAVCDDGPGVSAVDRDAIFERFNRGTAGHSTSGSGLGLAIGRELAEMMGGSLRLAGSRGRGARFELTLRAAGDQQELLEGVANTTQT